MRLAEDTPASFRVVSSRDDRGTYVFCALLKRSYDILPNAPAVRASVPNPLILVDEYYDHGDPQSNCVKFENDLAPFKVATDVVVIGNVYAPGGRPVACLDASVEIAGVKKTIRALGDRRCIYRAGQPPGFTEPVPFARMEVRYERAYGGTDAKSIPEMPFSYPRNHIGRGLAIKNIPDAVRDLPLPNFEDPEDLLVPERVILGEPDRWPAQPLPQGLGWFQHIWYPRCSFAGSVPGFVDPDTVLKEEMLGLVPKGQIALARRFRLPGFDIRFNNGASPGLAVPFLAGGEKVRLVNLTPDGLLEFSLPVDPPRIAMDIGFGRRELTPVLHTVCVRVEDRQLDLVWRGAHEFPGPDWLPEMRRFDVEVS